MHRIIFCLTLATVILPQPMPAQPGALKAALQATGSSPVAERSMATQRTDTSTEATIRDLEHKVEAAIVNGDTSFLKSVYADDFRFTHYTAGEVSDKAQTLEAFARRPFVSRRIDALNVEIHGDIAVTYGLLDMTSRSNQGEHSFLLKYVRVYEQKDGRWQMLMHRSLEETSPIAFDVSSR